MDVNPAFLLSALDPHQREAATCLSGPVQIRAGAGTGKTRAITHRIAYAVHSGAVPGEHILALTFTERAAGELKSRLRALGVGNVQARTFHSAALAQLRYFWPEAVGGCVPQIRENKVTLAAQAAHRLNMPTNIDAVRDFCAEIEWAKSAMVAPEDYPRAALAARREEPAAGSHREIARLMKAYEEVKCERGVIDFEDVLLVLAGIIADRKDIAARIRSQYRYFIVDEYQDVSALQECLLRLWLGRRNDICVVGDAAQTIFSFAGAEAKFLLSFPQRYPSAAQIVLDRDYRSTPQIVALANALIGAGDGGSVRLRPVKPLGNPVGFAVYRDDAQEAEKIAAHIGRKIGEGRKPADFAILYRTNMQADLFERALAEKGIPCRINGNEKFFSRRQVREVMAALRGQAGSCADLPLTDVVEETLRLCGWRPTPPAESGESFAVWQALRGILDLARQWAQEEGNTLRGFAEDLAERARTDNPPQPDAVTLCSLHSAKGLEWPVVFLTGMSEGLMPVSRAKTEALLAEEKRLLYVGITRAREELYLSYAQGNGQRPPRKVSRFLRDLWRHEASAATRKRRAQKAAQADFPVRHPNDTKLFAALCVWRGEVCAESGKTESAVMHDSVLRSIAVLRPRTLEELGRIRGVGMTKIARYGTDLLRIVNSDRGIRIPDAAQ